MRNPARDAVSLVDPVELRQSVALGLDDADAVRTCLVHVLAPFLAQPGLKRRLVLSQVDEPGGGRLDRLTRSPAGGTERPPRRPVLVQRPVELDLGVDAEMADPARLRRQAVARRLGERADPFGRPRRGHRTAGCVGETPRQGRRTTHQHLGRRLGVARGKTGRRPAVDGLDPGPCGELEVRARVGGLDERVPRAVVGEPRIGRLRAGDLRRLERAHAACARRRRTRSVINDSMAGSSGIRNASDPASSTMPPAAPTMSSRIRTVRKPG